MAEHEPVAASDLPTLKASGTWNDLLQPARRADLEAILPAYILQQRWFGAKARQIETAHMVDSIALSGASQMAYLTFVRLAYRGGGEDTYALPLTFAPQNEAEPLLRDRPRAVVARVQTAEGDGLLFDALFDPSFCTLLLDLIAQGRDLAGEAGGLDAETTAAFPGLRGQPDDVLTPKVSAAEQSNTSIIYGGRLIMKLFRKVEPGINPDLEIGRFLTERSAFDHVPPAAGTIEYRNRNGETAALAFLQGFVANQGDAWSYTLREIVGAYQQLLAAELRPPDEPGSSLLDLADGELPQQASDVIGGYLESAALLGRLTAELHRALAADTADADFAPEPFDEAFRRTVAASVGQRAEHSFATLRSRFEHLPETVRSDAQRILDSENQLLQRLHTPFDRSLSAVRTRIHGDYHLGQVLYTGDDFFIIDFEGEPARPLRERRIKSSPLQDVAGMLRSFHYAPYAALLDQASGTAYTPEQVRVLEPWARFWHRSVSATFLKSYLATLGPSPLVPDSRDELGALLDVYLLDKALYELTYELNNRPTWVRIPVEGVLQLLQT